MKNNFPALLLLVAAMASCRKDGNPPVSTPSQTFTLQQHPAEKAYPGIQGRVIGIQHGSDSIFVEKKGGGYVWMGDILLDEQHFNAMKKSGTITTDRTFTEDYTRLWPSGQVFYALDPNFTATEQGFINDAIADYQNNTPIRFTARTNQSNYIYIQRGATGTGLYSTSIGMAGGQQIINLEGGMFGPGEIEHEMGHAIGFYHEQCRTDRDVWINVNYNYIYPNTQSNIYQYQTYDEIGSSGWQIDQFDFNSIMLYSSYDLVQPGTNNYPMTLTNGQPFNSQRNALSAGDIATVFYMYQPVYVRATLNYTDDENDQTYQHSEGTVSVNFYSDAAGTVPATLTYPLELNYAVVTTSDCSGTMGVENTFTIIPAGNPGTVTIGNFSMTYTYDSQMDPLTCYSQTTGVAPGVGYWQIY
ncbi:M12 family metallopeptidase [Dinghuibacter silviterrae]|uniref:Astacin (Peptidase family M12A) n=1 Tax=Dinghuibacter silviterrae TaxID=1539049 RepID=A0A4R8DHD8_9BACT|nr:M12 family metallopeptidase [Dinghuibacter silviterrae]TDW96526.1 astacin (peptidase family M12A) [Dinghuibacter silviterrae]